MAFSSSEQERVYSSTWGELAPSKNVTYKGKVLIAVSNFGSSTPIIIDFEFDKNLESSPWLFESLELFLSKNDKKLDVGVIYQLSLTMRNYRWWGKIIKKSTLKDRNIDKGFISSL